jgi:hypothetical protein
MGTNRDRLRQVVRRRDQQLAVAVGEQVERVAVGAEVDGGVGRLAVM